MNKSESLDEHGLLAVASGEAYKLGFGDPVAISAETGLGMAELYEILQPIMEDYVLQLPAGTILDFLYCCVSPVEFLLCIINCTILYKQNKTFLLIYCTSAQPFCVYLSR
jgi:hypothetical protein